MSPKSLPNNVFRANVGIVVLNGEGKVLALERDDTPSAWQLPQGGLKKKETPLDAALRELQEETAIKPNRVQFIAEYPEWLAYELPQDKRSGKTGRGQVQKWFVFRFKGEDTEIDLDNSEEKEFQSWTWMPLRELAMRTVAFRRSIYNKLITEFAVHLSQ